ncbi:arabinofuranosidase catalytic domain-containing protein [Rhizomicrobium electricum]|uniref:LTD domain-containing protein n=1 Tax=Rhizomicrobium electricum TaxID=480070 RepID=A0ABN1EKS9_9PROT|nr:arabinofuranosidase catalytic domain-containing protein [Rhizomicrobium electricum]NIJ47212.1 hypothetical protein [Rhizomicrobium electricum]
METKKELMRSSALALVLVGGTLSPAHAAPPSRPQGPCDIYAAAGTSCVAAHSTTRALYASYNGPLYQVVRWSDGKTLDIGIVQPSGTDAGGYADAAAQDKFCANTHCSISILYDQSDKHNDLKQAPRGGFSGPSLGGFNNLPLADMAPITIMGHKAYGVFIAPGMGLRLNDAKGTAVDDQAEGQYWVINGQHYNSGCCFDYGNAEIDSRDDGNGTMETTYYGNASAWYHGTPPGPWIMTDQENNLVGCVNEDKSKFCKTLQSITWRFVTAMAKGKPHHWTSLGGDAQNGPLSVLFDGSRIDATYDPMRKQGAILLGNGGDNSTGSQGTFYEGAMTAAGTFPSDATDQAVQANVVAAKYDVPLLSVAPASAVAAPTGLQTFSPGASQETTVTFTNTTRTPATGVKISVEAPKGWTVAAVGTKQGAKTFADPIAPGASVSATFKITAGRTMLNGDLVAKAVWTSANAKRSETAVEKVRNVAPVKINEFRVSDGSVNTTNSFIELYNAGPQTIDISGWTLTQHAHQQAVFSAATVPSGTKLVPGGFYLLGLSNSGLAVAANAGDTVVHVRNTDGMNVGDAIVVGDGVAAETRKIASLGTAAHNATTLWQPAEDPMITIPAGSTNVPVADVSGFKVGEKIALGYGTTYPVVGRNVEKYEVATVTAVGKPGTQAYLEADAPAGSTTIQTAALANISAGDTIRLDIESVGHGIETVTVKSIGTAAKRTALVEDVKAGSTAIKVRGVCGWPVSHKLDFSVGGKLIVGTPASKQTVTITAVVSEDPMVTRLEFKPALAASHISDEDVVELGTGIELTAPLKYNHAANLPFSVRGTGISFAPATAFPHSTNEPVQALGTGIALDRPLTKSHPIETAVRDAVVKTAGYQDAKAPNQWFGGPVLSVNAGSMVLRDASGRIVDSLNYGNFANNGNIVDPWAAEGYHAVSGAEKGGCFVPTPGAPILFPPVNAISSNSSAGRFPDGRDTDSNCTDFRNPVAATLPQGAVAGASVVKVSRVADFHVGQTVLVGAGDVREAAKIAAIGTSGATTARAAVVAGETAIAIADPRGFQPGQAITIDDNANAETAVVASSGFGQGGFQITVTAPLKRSHIAGVQVSGTGITLAKPLSRAYASGAQLIEYLPTPGAPNKAAAE